jgi:hypothetical protein
MIILTDSLQVTFVTCRESVSMIMTMSVYYNLYARQAVLFGNDKWVKWPRPLLITATTVDSQTLQQHNRQVEPKHIWGNILG